MRRLVVMIVLGLLGCANRDACPPGQLEVPNGTPAFVVVRSDYSSSAIALLAADGTVLESDFIDSGSRPAGLVTAVAGDTVVPTSPLGSGTVAWIGRLYTDVITLVTDGRAVEIDTRGEAVGDVLTGFTANAQDALRLPDGRILMTRLGVNRDASAPELQRGNDVVVIEGNVITRRIALADGQLDDCTGACTAYAHPSQLALMQNAQASAVVVALERSASDLQSFGPGAIAVIDPQTLTTTTLDLAPLENCQYVSIDRDDASVAYVACASDQRMEPELRRPHAGLAVITLDASGNATARVVQTNAPDPVINGAVIGVGHGRVLVIATESIAGPAADPDHLLSIDVASGNVRDLYRTQHGFALWSGTVVGDLALVPNHDTGEILRVDVSAEPALAGLITFDDCIDLPVFQVGRVSF